jgi:hypothetical protein
MAYSDYDTPGEVLTSGYTATSNNITMTIGTGGLLPGVSTAEANSTTGDFRKLMYGTIDGLYESYSAVPQVSKSTKMIISRSTAEDQTTGGFTRNYVFQFKLDSTGFEVADEV